MVSVLLIDANRAAAEELTSHLEARGCVVFHASSIFGIVDHLDALEGKAVVVVDFALPTEVGEATLRLAMKACPDMPIVLMSSFPDAVPGWVLSVVHAVVDKAELFRLPTLVQSAAQLH